MQSVIPESKDLVIAENSGGGPCGYKTIGQLQHSQLKQELHQGVFGKPGTASAKTIEYLLIAKGISSDKTIEAKKAIEEYKIAILEHQPQKSGLTGSILTKDTDYLTTCSTLYKHLLLGEQQKEMLVFFDDKREIPKQKEGQDRDSESVITYGLTYLNLHAVFTAICENKGELDSKQKENYKDVCTPEIVELMKKAYTKLKQLYPDIPIYDPDNRQPYIAYIDCRNALLASCMLTRDTTVLESITKNMKPSDVAKSIKAKMNGQDVVKFLKHTPYTDAANSKLPKDVYADQYAITYEFPRYLQASGQQYSSGTLTIPAQEKKGNIWHINHIDKGPYQHWNAMITKQQFEQDHREGMLFKKFGKYIHIEKYPDFSKKEMIKILESAKSALTPRINTALTSLIQMVERDNYVDLNQIIDAQLKAGFADKDSNYQLVLEFFKLRLDTNSNLEKLIQTKKEEKKSAEVSIALRAVRQTLADICKNTNALIQDSQITSHEEKEKICENLIEFKNIVFNAGKNKIPEKAQEEMMIARENLREKLSHLSLDPTLKDRITKEIISGPSKKEAIQKPKFH